MAKGKKERRQPPSLPSLSGKILIALAVDGLFGLQVEGVVGVGHEALLVGLDGQGEGLEVRLSEAAVPQGPQGQNPLQQGVQLGDGVLGLAAQDLGHQLLEAHDLAVGLVLVIVVHDGAEEHIVALAVGHVIGAAQGKLMPWTGPQPAFRKAMPA